MYITVITSPFFLFVLGTIVGSFLNVVIFRLHTGKSLKGHSHCLSCGKQLSWYELVPLFSYLAQRGSCRTCGSFITPRYFMVELATGLLFASAAIFSDMPLVLLFELVLFSLLVVITIYDIRHTIIPDELVLALLPIVAVLIYLELSAVWWRSGIFAVAAGSGAALFFASLWYVSGGRWIGLGDAKLAFPLGALVGVPAAISMVVLSFWIGAVLSLLLLLWQRLPSIKAYLICMIRALSTTGKERRERQRRACSNKGVAKYHGYFTIKSEVPFAPFLVAGFLVTHILKADVFAITDLLLDLFL